MYFLMDFDAFLMDLDAFLIGSASRSIILPPFINLPPKRWSKQHLIANSIKFNSRAENIDH